MGAWSPDNSENQGTFSCTLIMHVEKVMYLHMGMQKTDHTAGEGRKGHCRSRSFFKARLMWIRVPVYKITPQKTDPIAPILKDVTSFVRCSSEMLPALNFESNTAENRILCYR